MEGRHTTPFFVRLHKTSQNQLLGVVLSAYHYFFRKVLFVTFIVVGRKKVWCAFPPSLHIYLCISCIWLVLIGVLFFISKIKWRSGKQHFKLDVF